MNEMCKIEKTNTAILESFEFQDNGWDGNI